MRVLDIYLNMNLDEFPIAPNPDQQNADKLLGNINDGVKQNMGVLTDTGPEGRPFLDGEHNLFGYDGVVVTEGRISSLVNLGGDENVPTVSLGTEVVIEGNSSGYVSSGHKPGDRVKVINFIEPFHSDGGSLTSSDKIIQVEGAGVVGWIKPSEFSKSALKEERDKELKKLFDKPPEGQER